MTITVSKRDRGEDTFGPGGGRTFYVAVSDDPATDTITAARAATITKINADGDGEIDGVALFGVEAREIVRTTTLAGWIMEARYGSGGGFATSPQPARPAFTASLTTEKVIRSRAVVASGASGGGSIGARDNLIGVDTKGNAEGTDVLVPVFTIVYSDRFTDSEVNSLATFWAALSGHVNSAMWKGYPAGSLLFSGVNAEPDPSGGYTVRAEFGYRPNETGINVGDGMTGVAVDGWDILDVTPTQDFDATIDAKIAKADFYHVHRLYPRSSFASLGFGT